MVTALLWTDPLGCVLAGTSPDVQQRASLVQLLRAGCMWMWACPRLGQQHSEHLLSYHVLTRS